MSRLVSPFMIPLLPGLRQFDFGLYDGATFRLAVELEPPAQQGYPLAHARQADLLAAAVRVRRPFRHETASLVADQQPDHVSRTVQYHARLRGPRVLADVRQGLLGDPEERGLDLLGQAPIAQGFFQVDLQAVCPQLRHLEAHGGGQPEVVQHRGAEVVDHLPRLPDQLPHQLQRFVQLFLIPGRTDGVVAGEGLEVLVGGRRALGETVVDVVGDAAALFFLGSYEPADQVPQLVLALGELRVEPGVLQGARGLAGEAVQGLCTLVDEGVRAVGFQDTDQPVLYEQGQVEAYQILIRFVRSPQPEQATLPCLQDLPSGGEGLGGEAGPAPEVFEPGRTPDSQLSGFVGDADHRCRQLRDAPDHLQQARPDFLPLQARAEYVPRLVECELHVEAALERFFCPLALGHVVGDDADRRPAVTRDGAGADLHVDEGAVLATVLPLAQRRPSLLHDASDVEVH